MNSFTIYILIGALILGIGIGERSERCGTFQNPDAIEALAFVMIWPSMLSMAFYDFDFIERPCYSITKGN